MQLLDCAGQIVLDHGLSKFTIDALAKAASVSVPLIYKYFDTRIEILQSLLVRESERITSALRDRLEQTADYEEVVRMFVTMNFDDARRGSLLGMLYSQPDIRAGLDSTDIERVVKILITRTMQEFDLSKTLARELVPMGSAASRTAAERFSRHGGNRDKAIDTAVRFILGAFRALGSDAPVDRR